MTAPGVGAVVIDGYAQLLARGEGRTHGGVSMAAGYQITVVSICKSPQK
jgi:hypothetical protein